MSLTVLSPSRFQFLDIFFFFKILTLAFVFFKEMKNILGYDSTTELTFNFFFPFQSLCFLLNFLLPKEKKIFLIVPLILCLKILLSNAPLSIFLNRSIYLGVQYFHF